MKLVPMRSRSSSKAHGLLVLPLCGLGFDFWWVYRPKVYIISYTGVYFLPTPKIVGFNRRYKIVQLANSGAKTVALILHGGVFSHVGVSI